MIELRNSNRFKNINNSRKIKKVRKVLSRLIPIVLMLFILTNFIAPMVNESYGAINENVASYDPQYNKEGSVGDVAESMLDNILGMALGAVGSVISSVALLIVGLLYILLQTIFAPITGQWGFPSIESIVFNGVVPFDPNFINPSGGDESSRAFAKIFQEPIKNVYQSGYVIAGSIFVIGAMIIGMKLAVSSIASEKAYYKEMIGTWVKGVALLFTVHILVTATFYLNEQIVASLSNGIENMEFTLDYEPSGGIAKIFAGLSNLANGKSQYGTSIHDVVYGINGLMWGLILKGITGDFLATIAVGALLGQTIALMVTYIRRLFVCIALGAIAPFIVAIDFLRQLI